MRYLGAMRDRKATEKACLEAAKHEENKPHSGRGIATCVIEKAQCKDHPSPKKYVCYRAWLDLDSSSGGVIDIKEWNQQRRR